MAQQRVGGLLGVAACNVASGAQRTNMNGSTTVQGELADATLNPDSTANLRTRLAAISAGTYTSAYLDKMTHNDMLYALRLNDFPLSVK